jgi:hypothetical protein
MVPWFSFPFVGVIEKGNRQRIADMRATKALVRGAHPKPWASQRGPQSLGSTRPSPVSVFDEPFYRKSHARNASEADLSQFMKAWASLKLSPPWTSVDEQRRNIDLPAASSLDFDSR